MTMERWEPERGVLPRSLAREMEEMEGRFGDVFGRWPTLTWRRLPRIEREWMPAVDVFEKDDKLVVKAELPGMKLDDIDVSVQGQVLTVKGEKKAESQVKEDNYYRSERTYGGFMRSVTLPSDVDQDAIEATYKDGVLEVTVPKHPEAKAKKVTVEAKK